mgnify:CR=1 FL=1
MLGHAHPFFERVKTRAIRHGLTSLFCVLLAACTGQNAAIERTSPLTAPARYNVEIRRTAFAIPHIKLNGPPVGDDRHPANLNLSVEFVEGEGLALMLDAKGIALAAGAACVTRSMRIPPILAAIGLPEALAKGNVLLSFGKDNTEAEVDYFLETFAKTVSSLREMSPLWDDFQRGLIKSAI